MGQRGEEADEGAGEGREHEGGEVVRGDDVGWALGGERASRRRSPTTRRCPAMRARSATAA